MASALFMTEQSHKPSRNWEPLKKIAAIVLVTNALITFFVYSCDSIVGCHNYIYRTAASPNSHLTAIVHFVDCGAVTPFEVSVALVEEGSIYNRARYLTVFSARGDYDVLVNWVDDRTLKIYIPKEALEESLVKRIVYIKRTRVRNVDIIYEGPGAGVTVAKE